MKVLMLADSCALPRSFPKSHAARYEETYPYLLKKAHRDHEFLVVAFGGATSTDLVGNAVAYYEAWQPDLIIVQCGAADCMPLPVPALLARALVEYESLGRLAKFVFRPDISKRLMRLKCHDRVPLDRFAKNVDKLQLVFPSSQILWLEIFTSNDGVLEASRPGVLGRMERYNETIRARLGSSAVVELRAAVNSVDGVHDDRVHLNRRGHHMIHTILSARLQKRTEQQPSQVAV